MVNIAKLTKQRLGELLVGEGLITDAQVQEALAKQKETGELLGEVLVKLNYVTEFDIVRTLCTQFGLPYLDASRYDIGKEVVAAIPSKSLQDNQFCPLDKMGNVLVIAVSGVLNEKAFNELEKETGCKVQIFVSTSTQVRQALKRFQELRNQVTKILPKGA